MAKRSVLGTALKAIYIGSTVGLNSSNRGVFLSRVLNNANIIIYSKMLMFIILIFIPVWGCYNSATNQSVYE